MAMFGRSSFSLLPVIILVCAIFTSFEHGVDAGPHEDQLIKRFFFDTKYHVSSRPVPVETDAIDVKFGLSLQQIIDVNEKNEMLHTNLWLKYEWIDYKLQWNVSDYGGVESIRLPSSEIWTPDILLYNSASEAIDSKFPTNVVVSSTGLIAWVPLGLYTSACGIDITWFPFDDQKCTMKFGSWTYDGNKINLTSFGDEIDMSTYQPSGEWDIVGVPAKRSVVSYECCPEPYIDITFTIHIRRRTLYYGINLIIPCAMISFLALLTFILPPDEGEKIGLGITILLSLSVFQLIVAEAVPATSLAVPLLGVYFSTMMFMCTLSVISTVVVLNYHHRSPDMYDMPEWVRIVFCEWLAWILRIKRPGRDLTFKSLLRKRKVRQLEALSPPSASLINNVKDIDNIIPVPPTSGTSASAPVPSYASVIGGGVNPRTNGTTSIAMPTSYIGGYYDNENKASNSSSGPSNVTTGDDPNLIAMNALTAGLTSTMSGVRGELLSILSELRWLTNKMKDDSEAGDMTNDWKFVAMVIDRLCLWVFSIFFAFGSLFVFLRAPNLYVS